MLDVSNVRVCPFPPDSPWLKAFRLTFTQDGKSKNWDLTRAHDSVGIIIFNISRKKLVFVRQFRPACYYRHVPASEKDIDVKKYPAELGLSIELCAGIVDKDKSLVEIAREEVMEECGYEVPVSAFEKIISSRYNNMNVVD